MGGKRPDLRIKRAYEPPAPEDGARVLVDRLWPRGIGKGKARLDAWLKEAAPSDALRKWFGHEPEKWAEFKRRYARELARPEAAEALASIRSLAAQGPVTLVYAASDETCNNAAALREFLAGTGGAGEGARSEPARARKPKAGRAPRPKPGKAPKKRAAQRPGRKAGKAPGRRPRDA